MSHYNFGRVLFLCFYVVCFCLPFREVSGSNETVGNHFEEHQRLLELLMNNSNVNRQILPAFHINKPVNVEMGIKLRQIANVDEKNQVIRLILWLTFQWLNPHLKWNPAEHGGINSVHVDHDLFWFPDVAVFNEAGFESEIVILHHRLRTKMVITKDGYCTWQAPVTLNSYCTLDLTDFPFDEQECPVQIGSWTHPGEEINMTYSDQNADLSHYIRSGEWILQSATLSQDFGYYKPEISPHPHITLALKIERRPDYYKYQIIIPLAVITVLATYSFILPLKIYDQISIVLTIVVSISVYGVIISSALPKTADPIPALQKFCFQMLMLTVGSSIHMILTSRLVERTSEVPKYLLITGNFFHNIWLKIFLPVVSCIKCPGMQSEENAESANATVEQQQPIEEQLSPRSGIVVPPEEETSNPAGRESDVKIRKTGEENTEEMVIETSKYHDKSLEEKNNDQWKIVATCVRSIFLIVFLSLFVRYLVCLICKM